LASRNYSHHSVLNIILNRLGCDCEISWVRVPYLSALEVWSQGAIHVYLYLYL